MKKRDKKTKPLYLTLILLILMTTLMGGCSSTPANVIRIGMIGDHLPWEFKGESGEPAGISVDLATAFAKEEGKVLKIIWFSGSEIFDALKANKIDMILSSMTIEESRLRDFDISDPYTKVYPMLLIRKDSSLIGKNQLNQSDRILSVILDTQAEVLVRSNYSKAFIISYPDRTQAVAALKASSADAFADDSLSVLSQYELHPNDFRINPAPLSDDFQYYVAYFNKGEDSLKDTFNKFLTQSRRSGYFDTLSEKYIHPFGDLIELYQLRLSL